MDTLIGTIDKAMKDARKAAARKGWNAAGLQKQRHQAAQDCRVASYTGSLL